jgi:hypothetical protein
MASMPNMLYQDNCFEITEEKGFICEKVKGRVSVEGAEKSARFVMELAAKSNCRKLLVDADGLEWINDLSLRMRGVELVSMARKLFDQVAIVSSSGPVRYLVSGIMKGGGLKAKSFKTVEPARKWLNLS